MLDPKTIVEVSNRSDGVVAYTIPERNIFREFNKYETKKVEFQEILEVCAQPGGRELFHNYLLIHNEEAILEATNIQEEVEYFMTAEEIKEWMPTCSLDAFKDALDFAPEGVLDLIKKYAVTLPLNDVEKRNALLEQLNFDVTKAIDAEVYSKEEQNAEPAQRRVKAVETKAEDKSETPTRRVITIPNKK